MIKELLVGIVGSTAYGLNTPNSDIDQLGMGAEATRDLVGLDALEKNFQSVCTKDPDLTMHEAAKYCKLALACNPTVSELMWLPEECYTYKSILGADLIDIRNEFLSAKRVKDAYLGYATQQFRRLQERGKFASDIPETRTAKHARHLMRLVKQGTELYTTGYLRIKLINPQQYFDFGEKCAEDPDAAIELMSKAEDTFRDRPTALPPEPNRAVVEDWLRTVREVFWVPDTGLYSIYTRNIRKEAYEV
jgi:uncharacterized protein